MWETICITWETNEVAKPPSEGDNPKRSKERENSGKVTKGF
jgi:hypothetical protein